MATYDLTPARLDLLLVAGDDWEMEAVIDGNRMAYTFTGYVEATPGASTTTMSTSVGSYVTASNSTPVTFSLTSTDTDPFTGTMVWAARWKVNGKQRTFLAGDVTVTPEVAE